MNNTCLNKCQNLKTQFVYILFCIQLNRGYYMAMWRYEIYLKVLKIFLSFEKKFQIQFTDFHLMLNFNCNLF